jgi:hypothetical protein
MANLGDLIPPREDEELRQQRDFERRQQEEAAARRAARTQIGDGGVLKVDGTLQVTGDLEVPSGALSSAGNMTAGVDVVAGRDVTAVRDVTAGRDVAAVAQVRGDNGLFPGGINSVDVYNRLVTGSGSFRTTSTNILGQMGQTVSSQRFKQDIVDADVPRETLRKLRLVFFRYTAAVPFDQDQQPLLLGLIAEEVHDLGLTWLVVYDDEQRPEALVDFALPFLGLLLAQSNADEIEALRSEIAELKRG